MRSRISLWLTVGLFDRKQSDVFTGSADARQPDYRSWKYCILGPVHVVSFTCPYFVSGARTMRAKKRNTFDWYRKNPMDAQFRPQTE
ncbi:hypothetical protein [Dyadobacter bucti]|uniref:hypothetical protein n=1 Tax=Dyadobacter bucti TaxID=2572203 RepID=UPI003F6F53D2